MKKAPWMCLPIAAAFLFPFLGFAQTPSPADQAQEQGAGAQTANRPTTDWRITEKEVKAVQAELISRGYYKSKITGVLDPDTPQPVPPFQSHRGFTNSRP